MSEPTNEPTSQPMTREELELMAAYQEATGALLCFDTSKGFAFKDEVYQWVADGCPTNEPAADAEAEQ
jgi:hypothetical protein